MIYTKKQSNTFLLSQQVIKIIPLQVYYNIEEIKHDLIPHRSILLYHKSFRIRASQVCLFFDRMNGDIERKTFFESNYLSYVDFISPTLLGINTLHVSWDIGITHDDPHIDNYVLHKNDQILLIDIESFKKESIIYQPLYLFIKFFLYESKNDTSSIVVFAHIFKIFFWDQNFRWAVEANTSISELLLVYVEKMKWRQHTDFTKAYKFMSYNHEILSVLLEKLYKLNSWTTITNKESLWEY